MNKYPAKSELFFVEKKWMLWAPGFTSLWQEFPHLPLLWLFFAPKFFYYAYAPGGHQAVSYTCLYSPKAASLQHFMYRSQYILSM